MIDMIVFIKLVIQTKDKWRKRFKGQQGDIIQFIIDDNFNSAVLLASLCWAILPDFPYGQQSSTYNNEDVKKIYEKYLKEELSGEIAEPLTVCTNLTSSMY